MADATQTATSPWRNALGWVIAIAVVSIALGISTASANSATPTVAKKWYWTESRANALVVAKVRIPFCRVVISDPRCVNGHPAPGQTHLIGARLDSAKCTGANELGSTFRYNRFSCDVITFNNGPEGNIAVYVTGASTFRWKII